MKHDAQALANRLGAALSELLIGPADDGEDLPALTLMPAAQPGAPALLAQAHPGGPRAHQEAQALYGRCLVHYRTRVQRGLPEDDVGLAAAYFVLACVAALQQIDIGEAQLALVERQMRRVIGGHPAWLAADAAERQALFEQFAILGALVGEGQYEARSQGAAARANVQRAARDYLRRLLGLNPDSLRLGVHGLELSVTTGAVAAALDGAAR